MVVKINYKAFLFKGYYYVTQTNIGICWHWKLHFLSLFLSLILSDFNLRNMCSGNSSSIIFILLEFVCLLLQTPTAIQSSNNAGVKRVVRQARNIMSVRHLLHTNTPYPDIIQIFLLYISKARSKNLNFRQRLNKEAVSAEETVFLHSLDQSIKTIVITWHCCICCYTENLRVVIADSDQSPMEDEKEKTHGGYTVVVWVLYKSLFS